MISRSGLVREEAPDGASFRWRAPCGDIVTRDHDELTIETRVPIEGLDAASYRKSVLLFRNQRFILVDVAADDALGAGARRPRGVTYRLRLDRDENLYELRGEVIEYDPDRHLEKQRERRRIALGFLIWVPLVPLTPVLGLLPESVKQKLAHVGLNPARATQFSLAIEWLLVLALSGTFFAVGMWFTLPGFITGVLALLLDVDIAYRMGADADNQAPGMFGIVSEFKKLIVTLIDTARGRDRLLPDANDDDADNAT